MGSVMLAIALVVALEQQPVADSEAPPRGYLNGAMLVSAQPGHQYYHRVLPPLGGTGVVVSASAGRFVTPETAVEGEFVLGSMSSPQTFGYNWRTDYTAEARDVVLNANVRWKPRATVPVEIVGGGGIAFMRFAKLGQITTYTLFPPQPPSGPVDSTSHERALTFTGGVDLPLPARSRLAIVPSFRVRYIHRGSEGLNFEIGAGRFSYQFGASLRGRF